MLFGILNTIILLGSVQGFILSALLFFNPKKRLPEKFLSILLFLIALASLNIYLNESNTPRLVGVVLNFVPTIVVMPFGPLIYFYTRSLLNTNFHFGKKHKLHFIPVIIDVFPVILAWILGIGYFFEVFTSEYLLEWGNFIDQYNSYSDIPRWLSISFYLLLTRKYLFDFKAALNRKEKEKYSDHFFWQKIFINSFLIFQLIWFVFLVPYIIPSTRFELLDAVGYYPIYIPLVALTYGLGIMGYVHFRVTYKMRPELRSVRLSAEESGNLIEGVRKSMEADKLYLDPNLDLTQLVHHIGSDQRSVSYILNYHFDKSFNDLVNHYRVEEVKRRIMDGNMDHLTISGIASDCGFNSHSTFYRSFKQFTHLTPKEFLRLKKGS